MKRYIALLLAVIMALGCLTACSASGETTTPESTPASTDTAATGASTAIKEDLSSEYVLFCHYSGYSFWQDVWKGFEDAAKVFGVTPIFGGTASFELTEVLTALEQTIASKPAGIAVTAMDADSYIDPINKGIADGVPIVMFDTDSPNSNRYAFVGTENYSSGKAAAEWVGPRMDGEGTVILATNINNSNFIDRNNGFIDTLAANHPDINVVMVESGTDGNNEKIKSALMVNPDTKYIFATAGGACPVAVSAIDELGLRDQVKIITFDTEEIVLDYIDDGTVEASVSQSPYCMGWWSLVYLYFLSHDELVTPAEEWKANNFPFLPDTCDSGSMVVTKDTTSLFRRTYEYDS